MASGTIQIENIKTFNSVTQLGLAAGTTIAAAFAALPAYAMLACPAAQFASGETPSTAGLVTMYKDRNGVNGWIQYHGNSNGDYRHNFASGRPTGDWIKMIQEGDLSGYLTQVAAGNTYVAKGDIITEDLSADNVDVAAGGTGYGSIAASKTGYTPLGVVGYWLSAASESSANYSAPHFYACRLNGTNAAYSLRNMSDTAARVKVNVTVLYVRN